MNKILFLLLIPFSLLAQSQYDITTVLKHKFFDKNGNLLTGSGVIIGDIDSGIDIFHPMFFFADGGEYSFTDVNADGKLTPGEDKVTLNGKEVTIRYIKMRDNTWGMLEDYDRRSYNPGYDFLYSDVNNNKKRDYGTEAGFSESDPTYGEQLFIALDENNSGKIETGEKLIALKTSKVRAVREKDGTVRKRGVDLIKCEEDSSGHGTGVAGIILGGHYGVQKIHGIAPNAEIVVASIQYDYTPRFVRNFPDLIQFLKDEKINILLFEDGEWMYEFMDGSSPEEEMVNQMARDGITIIGGAGNLATGNMMIMDTLSAGETYTYKIQCPQYTENKINDGVFVSFLWTDKNTDISFTIESPDKQVSQEITGNSDIIKTGKYKIAYAKEISPKGTVMFRFGLSAADSGSVKGIWKFNLKSNSPAVIRGYVVDVSQSWSGTSRWSSNKITDDYSICFPSTADSCIAVGAFVVNFGFFDKVGDLADYSSRGYNITGKLGVDICGPGHTTITTEKNYSYMTFSGTSSAAPHVVGTAALLLQYNPQLTHSQIRQIIINSAVDDKFTGPVPNPKWGYGKLNIENAITYLKNNY